MLRINDVMKIKSQLTFKLLLIKIITCSKREYRQNHVKKPKLMLQIKN